MSDVLIFAFRMLHSYDILHFHMISSPYSTAT